MYRSPDLTKRLPAELLTMIFQTWKHLCGTKQHGLGAEWVRATWVSKTWREVALDTAALWSSVLVSWRLADDPALEMQLDRAQGVALDLWVSCPQMSNGEIQEAFSLVVSKTKFIKKLKIVYTEWEQTTVVEAFIKNVGAEVVSLSLLLDKESNSSREWEFTPDIFPRLRHLALDKIIPISHTPLLSLTQLEIVDAYDGLDAWGVVTPCTYVHKFLAACPNLEILRMVDCFQFPPHYNEQDQPVVALPKLRDLSVDDSAFEIAKALGSLRLQPSASFHIIADCEGDGDGDFASFIIPRNVSEALSPIRHTRCLSLMVGQHPPSHLSLRGSLGDTFEDGPADWSITIPDLTYMFASSATGASPNLELAKIYYLELHSSRFLDEIPRLVEPSHLVNLQLHFAHGLPVARDWSRFFNTTMPHLRTLGIGGGALVADVLKAFHADPSLCDELQDLTLCAATGRLAEEDPLVLFFREVVGGWARKRQHVGTGLRSLTVRMPALADGSGLHAEGGDDRGLGADAEPVGFGRKLREEVELLEDSVAEVVVETADCPACSMEYELPADPGESESDDDDDDDDDDDAEDGDEDSDGGSTDSSA